MDLEFWLNRYQTLMAALLAIGGVYWALRPAWRQVQLMEMQLADQNRERLAANHRMLAKAISVLDPDEAWRSKVQFDPRLTEEQNSDLDLRSALMAAFEERAELWQRIMGDFRETGLTADQFAAVQPIFEGVDSNFEKCRAELAPERREERDAETGVSPNNTEFWFYAADWPDNFVTYAMASARDELQRFQGEVVDQMLQA